MLGNNLFSKLRSYSPSPRYRKALFYHMFCGYGKKRACHMAGLSDWSYKDVFLYNRKRHKVVQEWKQMENSFSDDKRWLVDYYRSIITGDVQHVDKVTTYRYEKLRSTGLEPKMIKLPATETHREVTLAEKLAAAKELSVLLGIREEKTSVTTNSDLIDILRKKAPKKEDVSG